MKTALMLGATPALLGALAAFTLERNSPAPLPPFSAVVRGIISAQPRGSAGFGTLAASEAGPGVFTLHLGRDSQEGSILFSRQSGTRLSIGTYPISDRGDGADIRALVLTGSSTHPTGAFRAHSGELIVTAASDSTIAGTFRLEATGFTAVAPEAEDRRVSASGSFRAVTD